MGYQIEVPLGGLRWVRGSRAGELVCPVGFWYEGEDPRTLARGRIPASIALTLHPELRPVSRFDLPLEELPVDRQFLSVPSLAFACSNMAALSEDHRRRYVAGDPHAVGQLVAFNRAYEFEDWVSDARRLDPAVGRSMGPRRGRPVGSRDAMARGIAVVSYVRALRESNPGQGLSAVCKRLGETGRLGMGYERIRQMYREWEPEIRDKRRSALFFRGPRIPELGLGW